jgi:hypothetical protein
MAAKPKPRGSEPKSPKVDAVRRGRNGEDRHPREPVEVARGVGHADFA